MGRTLRNNLTRGGGSAGCSGRRGFPRFVNLVAENSTTRVCSLHRLDVSEHLFYPSTAEAESAAARPALVSTLASLPAAIHNFRPARAGRRGVVEQHIFALANPRRSESRILWRSQEGHTIVHDADDDSHTTWSMPTGLRYMGKRRLVFSAPVVAGAGAEEEEEQEDLFVMCSNSGYPNFQVLRFDHSKPKPFNPRTFIDANPPWEWDRLPPPPLSEGSSDIYSHTVLDGGRIICVSAMGSPVGGGGTYLFDTVRRDWMQHASSDWHMPFLGAPQYVPDLKLWLGVYWNKDDNDAAYWEEDRDRYHLCASSDLGDAAAAAAMGVHRPPPSVTVTRHWKEQGLETPVGWETSSAVLLDLGGGRFCIAKIIDEVLIDEYSECLYSIGNSAALLTGVELVRGAGDGCSSSTNPSAASSSSEGGQGFRMVVHKSLRYIFRRESIKWVL